MDLKQWREQSCATETLPSGLAVKYRKGVSLMDVLMIMDGEMPAPLAAIVNEMIKGKDVTVGPENFALLTPLVNGMVKAALIEPPAADEPSETHVGINELPATDRMHLFNLLNEGKKLDKFRAEPGGAVDPAQSGNGVPVAA